MQGEAVAALLDEMNPDEVVELAADVGETGDHGSVVGGEVRAGQHPEPAQHQPRVLGQRGVALVEDDAHRGLRIAGNRQLTEPVVVQLRDLCRDGHRVLRAQVRGRDAQGQRQPAAQPHQRGGGLRLGPHPVLTEHAFEQSCPAFVAERRQLHEVSVVQGQTAQVAAAGDDRQRPRGRGEQRPHLRSVRGVVEHQQQLPVRDQRAIEPHLLVQADRYGVDAQPLEDERQGFLRRHRSEWVLAAQVHEDLPVLETVSDPVRPVHGEGGLAHAAGARDDQHTRTARGEPFHHVLAPGERGEVGRQLPGRGCLVLRRRDLSAQDLFVQLTQRGRRVDPQLVRQHLADLPIRRECAGLLPGPVQREHQVTPEAVAQRMPAGKFLQFRDQLRGPPCREVRLDPLLQRDEALFHQQRHLVAVQRLRGDVAQHRPAPQRQRAFEVLPLDQRPEPREVELLRFDLGQVSTGLGPHAVRLAECLSHPQDHGLQCLVRPVQARRLTLPDPLHQLVHRHELVGAQQQRRE